MSKLNRLYRYMTAIEIEMGITLVAVEQPNFEFAEVTVNVYAKSLTGVTLGAITICVCDYEDKDIIAGSRSGMFLASDVSNRLDTLFKKTGE